MISLVIDSSISVLDCSSLLTSVHKIIVITYRKYYITLQIFIIYYDGGGGWVWGVKGELTCPGGNNADSCASTLTRVQLTVLRTLT